MKIARLYTAGACAALLLGTALPSAADTTVTFTAPPGFVGGSLDGFTFSSNFRVYNNDTRDAPLMEFYDQMHSITYDAGVFDFAGMSLSGRPWDGYWQSGSGTLTVDFRGVGGTLLQTQSFTLPIDDSFNTYGSSVAGVHEIDFGSYGFWPRVGSMTLADATPQSPVPEPAPLGLLGAGLAFVGFVSRRKSAEAVGPGAALAA